MKESSTQENQKEAPKSWLQYVTEQSWEPELLISGLAIYATLQMPGLFHDAYQYYQYNLQAGTKFLDDLLPLLIYCVFTAAAYILIVAFITHFMIRALWIGFVGLLSVYKDGVKYENLSYSEYFKQGMRKDLGSAGEMALRLDQISSLIFSIAFVVVMMMIAIAIWYFITFVLYNVLKLFLDPGVFEAYLSVLFYSLTAVFIIYYLAVLALGLERFKNNPAAQKWQFNLKWKPGAIFYPLVFKPVQFIRFIFQSHVSKTKFYSYFTGIILIFFVLLLVIEFSILAPSIFDTRSYYAARSSARHVEHDEYTSRLQASDWLDDNAVIEKPVISSGMMEVFIPYPKRLDEVLNQFCDTEEASDTLSNHERRTLENEQNIACAERFFSFAVDDTLELDGELMFTRHSVTGQEGYQSYVDISSVAPGRHMFQLRRELVTKEDSTDQEEGNVLKYETDIPFWVE